MATRGRCGVLLSAFVVIVSVLYTGQARAEDPGDMSRNYVGMNVWFNNDYNGANSFVDMMKHSREWRQYNWSNGDAAIDSMGWPMEDCSNVIFGSGNELGTYKLIFNGSAISVRMMWTGGSVSNLQYDAGSNTSTADVTLSNTSTGGLQFQGTKRTAAGATNSGITNVRLYRPGYATDGSRVFTDGWLTLMSKFQVIRFMDWIPTNTNPIESWSQRQTPLHATRPQATVNAHSGPRGVAIEHYIQLCNETNADLWMNFPCLADDDYALKTAQLILYGSDGTDPYTSPQASPVYPPLNANLKVYLEWANEIWNSAGGFQCYRWIKETTDAILASGSPHPIKYDGANDQYRAIARYTAWRTVECSKIFRQACGDAAMMTRVRPVLMGQKGGNWCNPAQLPFLDGFYATARPGSDPFPNTDPKPVFHYIYGAGGSSYYGVVNWSTDANTFFAQGNYPDAGFASSVGSDAIWAGNYGLKRISYEGGMGLDASWSATEQQKDALMADPRMRDLTVYTHDVWSQVGGDLAVYYCVTGPSDWEFTPATSNLTSPKLRAIDALRDTLPRAAATLGGVPPCEVVARTIRGDGTSASVGTFWNATFGAEDVVSGIDVGEWQALPVSVPADGYYLMTTRAAAGNTSARASMWVNGVAVDTFPFTGTNNTLINSPAVSVPLKQGLNVVRFQPTVNQWSLRSVSFEVDTSASGVRRSAGGVRAATPIRLVTGTGTIRLTVPLSDVSSLDIVDAAGRVVARVRVDRARGSAALPRIAHGVYVVTARTRDSASWTGSIRLP